MGYLLCGCSWHRLVWAVTRPPEVKRLPARLGRQVRLAQKSAGFQSRVYAGLAEGLARRTLRSRSLESVLRESTGNPGQTARVRAELVTARLPGGQGAAPAVRPARSPPRRPASPQKCWSAPHVPAVSVTLMRCLGCCLPRCRPWGSPPASEKAPGTAQEGPPCTPGVAACPSSVSWSVWSALPLALSAKPQMEGRKDPQQSLSAQVSVSPDRRLQLLRPLLGPEPCGVWSDSYTLRDPRWLKAWAPCGEGKAISKSLDPVFPTGSEVLAPGGAWRPVLLTGITSQRGSPPSVSGWSDCVWEFRSLKQSPRQCQGHWFSQGQTYFARSSPCKL